MILQRIALVYFVVAMIEAFTTIGKPRVVLDHGHFSIFTAYRWQWWVSASAVSPFSLSMHFSVFSHYTSYSMQDWRICSFHYIHNYNLCTLCSKLELLSARGWPTAPSLHSKTSFVPNSKAPLCHFILFWIKTCVNFQVVCGVRGHLGPACNAVGHVDRQVWGINHLYSYPVWIRHKVL